MITGYNFSIKGRRHIKKNLPCQDASGIKEITPVWTVACVADGVGSCKYADVASKIAVESVLEIVPKLFPAIVSDDAILTILSASMYYANNKILEYAEEQDYDINQCETTLVVELYNGRDLYYANAGDSGIVALDENGIYHSVTKVQKGTDGISVIPLSALQFEVGKADFSAVAVIGLTDGLLDVTVPAKYKNQKYPINVPFAQRFTDYGVFGCDDDEIATEYSNRRKDDLIKFLTSDNCSILDDDLSASVLINTDAEVDNIPYEAPDEYLIVFDQCSIYGKNRNKEFINIVREKNPDWSDEQVIDFANRYIKPSKDKTKIEEKPKEKEKQSKHISDTSSTPNDDKKSTQKSKSDLDKFFQEVKKDTEKVENITLNEDTSNNIPITYEQDTTTKEVQPLDINGTSKVEIQITVDEKVKYKHQIVGTSNTISCGDDNDIII